MTKYKRKFSEDGKINQSIQYLKQFVFKATHLEEDEFEEFMNILIKDQDRRTIFGTMAEMLKYVKNNV